MTQYKHILVGVDLSDESTEVVRKAKHLSTQNEAKLTIAHVVEPLAFAYGGDVPLDMSEAQSIVEKQARLRLNDLLQGEQLSESQGIVSVGQTSAEIHRLSQEKEADLIIVGSHGRHGLALLFGSTANGVLHGAKCDVLAVRV